MRPTLLAVAMCAALFSGVAATVVGQTAFETTAEKGAKAAVKPAGIVATVNGISIFRRDVERDVANALQGQQVPPDQLAKIKAAALQQRIDQALKQAFLVAQQVSVTKEEVDAGMDQLRKGLRDQKSSMDEFLARSKLTETALRASIGEQIAWGKFVQKNMSEENLEKFFKQFHERYDGTERRVSHILFRPTATRERASLDDLKKQATELRDKIVKGSPTFEVAAEKYSDGPSRLRGGDLGFIPPQGVMAEQFSEAAFAVKPGEISPPITTPFGVHLIKVTDIKPGKKTLRDVVKSLQPDFSQMLSQQLIAQQREAASIDVAADFPHFKKGTTELVVPETAGTP